MGDGDCYIYGASNTGCAYALFNACVDLCSCCFSLYLQFPVHNMIRVDGGIIVSTRHTSSVAILRWFSQGSNTRLHTV